MLKVVRVILTEKYFRFVFDKSDDPKMIEFLFNRVLILQLCL